MIRTAVATTALLTGLVAVAAGPAHADKCEDQNVEGKPGGKKNWHWETINGKQVQVIDTVVHVCGKVPRPNVIYVLQNKTINYEWENLKLDFVPLILSTVKKAPF
jgi:hypothetical protein